MEAGNLNCNLNINNESEKEFFLESQQTIVHSVSSISTIIRNTIDKAINIVAVKGEVSGLKIATSGHVYFNLKDANSLIACTCWKHVFKSIKIEIQDGAEITIYGKVTIYPSQSKYQISVEKIDDLGVGALMKLFQERKEKLEQEGFFAQKRQLPFLPSRIGIVTSLTGAVIMDILNRIKSRFPLKVIIWPSNVQGNLASKEIAEGIEGLNNLSEDCRPELIILARGGGSVEDLWPFNEEIVVKAIFNSKIPTISAVGHETDFTLADFAADLRASTPTAAAEIATPVLEDLRKDLNKLEEKLYIIIKNYFSRIDQKIDTANKARDNSRNILNWKQQMLDSLSIKIFQPAVIINAQKKLDLILGIFNKLHNICAIHEYKLQTAMNTLEKNCHNKIQSIATCLLNYESLIKSMSVDNILQKGFSIVRIDGKVISTKNLPKGKLTLEFSDGISDEIVGII